MLGKDQRLKKDRLARWLVAGGAVFALLVFEIMRSGWLGELPRGAWVGFETLLVALLGGLVYFGVDRWLRQQDERLALQDKAQQAEQQAGEARQRLDAALRINQAYAEAEDENEVIQLLLRLSTETVGARGASFVPLDERGQPVAVTTLGEMPSPVTDAWIEYLATPAVRQRCLSCQGDEFAHSACPLLKSPSVEARGMFCLPLRRGEQEYGVLNLYLPEHETIADQTQAFLKAIIDEAALALEGLRLRQRELATLRQLQAVREKTDLNSLLGGVLKNLRDTLEADFALVAIWNLTKRQSLEMVADGELSPSAHAFLQGIVQTVMSSREPVLLGNVSGDTPSSPGVRSLLAVPLIIHEQPALGALLVANQRSRPFNTRQFSMLQLVAGQVAFVLQNVQQNTHFEYQTLIQERTRLAREIHDGLAQTLGFLKLKSVQMRSYLDHQDIERLSLTLQTLFDTLSEAYQDTRQAIDGLRVPVSDEGLAAWLRQVVSDFSEYSSIPVEIGEPMPEVSLSPEVQAQLLRIVQEALSNVRKHAGANKVWVSAKDIGGDLVLEVRDDGRGFSPEDVARLSQHGLRGMSERAELIGADFQVISRPGSGTTVWVSLNLAEEERVP